MSVQLTVEGGRGAPSSVQIRMPGGSDVGVFLPGLDKHSGATDLTCDGFQSGGFQETRHSWALVLLFLTVLEGKVSVTVCVCVCV